ncbi:hypothetical protein AGMMS49992_13580 [Clostridia bacterium]|nr:hypothetical protein AGMMS49992_13580 [Clostridia bacterium]
MQFGPSRDLLEDGDNLLHGPLRRGQYIQQNFGAEYQDITTWDIMVSWPYISGVTKWFNYSYLNRVDLTKIKYIEFTYDGGLSMAYKYGRLDDFKTDTKLPKGITFK